MVPDGMPCRVIYAESAESASAVAALWCSRSTTAGIGLGKALRSLGIGARRRPLFVPGVQRRVPQAVACGDQRVALRPGKLCTACGYRDDARLVRRSAGAAARLRASAARQARPRRLFRPHRPARERMSLGGNAAHGVIRPVRRLDRQEKRRRASALTQRIQNSRRVFVRRTANVRYTRAGLRFGFSSTFGMGVSSGFAAVPPFDEAPFEDEPFEDGMPL